METSPAPVKADQLEEPLLRLRQDWDDQEARNSLIGAGARIVSSGVRSIFGPGASDEDDIAQETWVSFFRERRGYVLDNCRVCSSFLRRTARGLALDRVRSRAREVPIENDTDITDSGSERARLIFAQALDRALRAILADDTEPHMTIVFLGNRVLHYKPAEISRNSGQHLKEMLEQHLAEIAAYRVIRNDWDECCATLRRSMGAPARSADYRGPANHLIGVTILQHYERVKLQLDIARWTQAVAGRFARAISGVPEFEEWILRA